jgi:hypothetical protein
MERELVSKNIRRIESSISSIEERFKECKRAHEKITTDIMFDKQHGKTSKDILSEKVKVTEEMIEELKGNLKESILLLQQMAASAELDQVQRKVDRWQPENLLTMEMLKNMIEEE